LPPSVSSSSDWLHGVRESKQREEERVPARTIVAATRAAGCCGGSLVSVLVATVAEASLAFQGHLVTL